MLIYYWYKMKVNHIMCLLKTLIDLCIMKPCIESENVSAIEIWEGNINDCFEINDKKW